MRKSNSLTGGEKASRKAKKNPVKAELSGARASYLDSSPKSTKAQTLSKPSRSSRKSDSKEEVKSVKMPVKKTAIRKASKENYTSVVSKVSRNNESAVKKSSAKERLNSSNEKSEVSIKKTDKTSVSSNRAKTNSKKVTDKSTLIKESIIVDSFSEDINSAAALISIDNSIGFEEQDPEFISTASRHEIDLSDDVDFTVSSLRELPLNDTQIPRNAKPAKDIEDEFVDGSSFLALIDPDFADKYDAEDYDEDEDEENDEGDVELLEALSTPTRSAIRSTLDVPLTSNDYSERNQELFARRNEILARISHLEGKRKLSLDAAEELRRSRFLLDEATRAIIEFNYGLVLNYVRKFTSTTSRDDSADFEAAGVVGLMRSVSSYDPTRGTKFSTWAYKPIQREILKAVRDADFKQLNPGDFEKRPDILRAVKELQNGNDEFIPTFEQVAVQAGATLDSVKRILNAPIIESLSAPRGEDGDTSLTDMIEDPSAGVEDTALARQEIKDLEQFGLSCLDERELFVIGRRFGLDGEPPQRLSAIGSLLGLSREAVRQVEAKALSKLLHPVTRRRLVRHGRQ